jgi:FkbM family methyltransferase
MRPLKRLKKLWRAARGTNATPRAQQPLSAHMLTLKRFIESHGISAVVDVGANRGQFAKQLRARLQYKGSILSVEPLPDAFAALSQKARRDSLWTAMNCALGDADAVLPINVSKNSVSSSILPMLDWLVHAAPGTAPIARIDVPVRRLDGVPELRAAAAQRCLLKIDAQGYEYRILRGAGDVMDSLSLLYLESSLVPLYEGEHLIEDMIAFLRSLGFVPVEIGPGYRDRLTERQLQANILFAKAG